jgi:SMODS-associating 2TM, beta-strand rich effector domain
MKNIIMKPFISVFAGFTVLILFIAAQIQGNDLKCFIDFLRLIPTIATADFIAYIIFTKWLWKIQYLQGWLIPFPDLNGTWQGWIQTSWQDGNGNIPGPIPVILTIKQSFARISCVMRTAEMESHSYLEGFCIDSENQIRRLCYSYTSKPINAVRERSSPHDGTVLFKILGKSKIKLNGEYWTQRNRTGSIILSFRTEDLLDELPSNISAHPMSESE